jgi:hypothetical protein
MTFLLDLSRFCVCEREREGERETDRQTDRQKERQKEGDTVLVHANQCARYAWWGALHALLAPPLLPGPEEPQ